MKSLTQENAVDLPNVGVSSYIHDGGQGKICTACQKYESVSPCDVVFFFKGLKSNLCADYPHRALQKLTVLSRKHKIRFTSVHIFSTGIGLYRLLVTGKGPSAFPSAHHYQSQCQYMY